MTPPGNVISQVTLTHAHALVIAVLSFSSSSVMVPLSWARMSRIILPLSGIMLVAVEAQLMEVTLADQALFGLTQMEFTALVARTAASTTLAPRCGREPWATLPLSSTMQNVLEVWRTAAQTVPSGMSWIGRT